MEDRGMLGIWAAGPVIPDRYDRAKCETELRRRDENVAHGLDGWRPRAAFDVPNKIQRNRNAPVSTAATGESSGFESASSASTASNLRRRVDIPDPSN